MTTPRIVAKVPSIDGWFAVVRKEYEVPVDVPQGQMWVIGIAVTHWGVCEPPSGWSALASALIGLPSGSTMIPLDNEGKPIEKVLGYFGPGETIENWVKKAEEENAPPKKP